MSLTFKNSNLSLLLLRIVVVQAARVSVSFPIQRRESDKDRALDKREYLVIIKDNVC